MGETFSSFKMYRTGHIKLKLTYDHLSAKPSLLRLHQQDRVAQRQLTVILQNISDRIRENNVISNIVWIEETSKTLTLIYLLNGS